MSPWLQSLISTTCHHAAPPTDTHTTTPGRRCGSVDNRFADNSASKVVLGEHVLCLHQQLESTAAVCGISIESIFIPVSPTTCAARHPAHFLRTCQAAHLRRESHMVPRVPLCIHSTTAANNINRSQGHRSQLVCVCVCVGGRVAGGCLCLRKSELTKVSEKKEVGNDMSKRKWCEGVIGVCICVCMCVSVFQPFPHGCECIYCSFWFNASRNSSIILCALPITFPSVNTAVYLCKYESGGRVHVLRVCVCVSRVLSLRFGS